MPDSNITKNALAAAMKSLMEKTPFSKISVGDICELCQMNRKSFYYHFKDKYDLVNWIFYTEFISAIRSRELENGWELMQEVCEYFYQNRRFYMNALEVHGQDSFRDYFKDLLHAIIKVYFAEIITKEKDETFFINFFTDAIVVAIERWLCENPCRPPKEFVDLMRDATNGVAVHIVQEMEQEQNREA